MAADISRPARRWLAEPFVHFVGLGALIFAIHAALAYHETRTERRIEVTSNDLDRLRSIAAKQWGREPDPQQLDAMVQAFVREEVLNREAARRGLDRDDVVVRRRLAQKMEFLAQDDVSGPTDAELRTYFNAHASDYAAAEALRIEQVYFSRRIRGAAAAADAVSAKASLRAGQVVQGDSVPAGPASGELSRAALARDFGAAFADAVASQAPGEWSDPLVSAFGVHLVRVLAHGAPSVRFADVRERVRSDVMTQRVAQARDEAYARARQRYTVVIAREARQIAALAGEASR